MLRAFLFALNWISWGFQKIFVLTWHDTSEKQLSSRSGIQMSRIARTLVNCWLQKKLKSNKIRIIHQRLPTLPTSNKYCYQVKFAFTQEKTTAISPPSPETGDDSRQKHLHFQHFRASSELDCGVVVLAKYFNIRSTGIASNISHWLPHWKTKYCTLRQFSLPK